jgi:hypothetical protein
MSKSYLIFSAGFFIGACGLGIALWTTEGSELYDQACQKLIPNANALVTRLIRAGLVLAAGMGVGTLVEWFFMRGKRDPNENRDGPFGL